MTRWQVWLLLAACPWPPGARRMPSMQLSVDLSICIYLHSLLCVWNLVVLYLNFPKLVHNWVNGVVHLDFYISWRKTNIVSAKRRNNFWCLLWYWILVREKIEVSWFLNWGLTWSAIRPRAPPAQVFKMNTNWRLKPSPVKALFCWIHILG